MSIMYLFHMEKPSSTIKRSPGINTTTGLIQEAHHLNTNASLLQNLYRAKTIAPRKFDARITRG